MELLFKLPVEIQYDFKIKKFDNVNNTEQYLLSICDRNYLVNKTLFNLIKVIESNNELLNIKSEFEKLQNTNYSVDDIIIAINKLLVPINVVEPSTIQINERAKSFLSYKKTIFPKEFLHPITNVLKFLFIPKVFIVTTLLILLTHIGTVIFFLDNYKFFYNFIYNPKIFILSTIIGVVSVIFHEFGHSSACRYYGVEYEEIGIGIYLRFPVFYSNISNAWGLSFSQRAVIDIAGIYFQYIFNIFLLVLYFIFNQQFILNAIFMVIIQTLLSLNPFLRYDGYWLATDLLGIPNLRKRSSETMFLLIQKYLLKKNISIIQIHRNSISNKLFFVYAIVSNLFFVFFIMSFAITFPSTFKKIKYLFNEIFTLIVSYNSIEFGQVCLLFYHLIISLLIIVFSAFFIFIISKRILKLSYNIIELFLSRNDKNR